MRVLVVLLVAALALPPTAMAQSQSPPPVRMVDMTLSEPAVVDVPTSSVVNVENPPGNSPVTATVSWSYSDGRPLVSGPPGTPPQTWNSVSQPVNGGETIPFTLSFTPPKDRRGAQTIVATMSVSGTGTQSGTSTLTDAIFVADPKLNLTIANITTEVAQGGAAFARFFLRNDGNSNETPVLSLGNDSNFSLRLVSNFSALLPGESVTGFVLVRPLTDNASVNLSAGLTVNSSVRSELTYGAQLPAFHVNASLVRLGFRADATTPPATQQVVRGETLGVPVTLTNGGHAPDVFAVNLTLDRAQAWSARLALNASSRNVSAPVNNTTLFAALLPGESIRFDAVVTLNETGAAPPANLTIDVVSLHAPLLGALDPEGHYRATRTTLLTAAGPDLAVASITGPVDAYPGEAPTYAVLVENRGRVATNASAVDLVVQDNLHTVLQTTLAVPPLAPGAAQKVSWAVPMETLRGAYRLTATSRPNATDLDTDPSNNLASQPVFVRSPSLELRVPDEVIVVPGTTLLLRAGDAALKLVNRGDRPETIAASLSSADAPWLAAQWSLDVPSGGTVSLPLELRVPDRVGSSSLRAKLVASIAGHDGYAQTIGFDVQVRPVAPPAITVLSPLASGRLGAPAELRVRVVDAIRVEHAEARVLLPDGQADAVPLLPVDGAPDEFSATYVPRAAGTTILQFSAAGAGSPMRTASVPNVQWNVTTGGYAGVAPVGFAEGSTIGNRTLSFAEVARGTTRALFVDVGDGAQAVPAPYVVSAGFWKDGPHTIGLRAVSNEGDVWTSTINVTLASSPPTLSAPEITSVSSGQILVSVSAKGASSVVARITADGKTIEVPLSPAGAERFSARVDPPAGWDAVTLTATATSGTQSSLVVEAPAKGHGLPGPGPALVLLGLVGVALLRRRTSR